MKNHKNINKAKLTPHNFQSEEKQKIHGKTCRLTILLNRCIHLSYFDMALIRKVFLLRGKSLDDRKVGFQSFHSCMLHLLRIFKNEMNLIVHFLFGNIIVIWYLLAINMNLHTFRFKLTIPVRNANKIIVKIHFKTIFATATNSPIYIWSNISTKLVRLSENQTCKPYKKYNFKPNHCDWLKWISGWFEIKDDPKLS